MPYTIVNHGTKSTSGAGSLTTDTWTATAGNVLIVLAYIKADAGLTITTSGGDTIINIDAGNNTPALKTAYLVYFDAIVGGAGYSITLTPGGGSPIMSVEYLEVSGLTPAPFDTAIAGNNTPATTTATSTASSTTAQADELAVSTIFSDSNANPATLTAAGGWTESDKELNGNNGASGMAYQTLSSIQTVTADWTTDSTTSRVIVATFKVASVSASTAQLLPAFIQGTAAHSWGTSYV